MDLKFSLAVSGLTRQKVVGLPICSRTLVDNKLVDNSDVGGASRAGAAPSTSSFSTWHLASMDWPKTSANQGAKHLSFWMWGGL